ncbi:MAG: glycosyltransferase 2 family protein [Acidimicrobiaceae bacterium]|nr:glycosyltransferase 2 family protein [Acidimicrobiaceae bacterium]
MSVIVLIVVLRRAHLSSLEVDWDAGTVAWLSAALVVTFAGVLLSALRWQRVLTALGLPAGIPTLVRHHLAGLFVSSFLPSTVGGDVLRVSRLAATNGEAPRTFASVVLERLTGWVVLPVITLCALAVNPGLFGADKNARFALLIALCTLTLLALVLWAVGHPKLGGRFSSNAGWRRFAGAVHLGVDRLRHQPGDALSVLATGFAYQLAVVLAAFLAAEALGLHLGPTALLAFVPAVAIVQVLPITVGGLGVREGAFVLFLVPLGVAEEKALALGLLVYAVNLVVSLLGAPAFALNGRTTRMS